MRIVVDTNCLLASIPPQSGYYWLYQSFTDGKFDWLVSNEILTEYEEKITDRYSGKAATLVLNILSAAPNVIFTEPSFKWQLIIGDPDDNKFADLAVSGNASYLVTNDKDFNVLKSIDFPVVNVVSIHEFKDILGLN
ncbi:putative toxin-antitoxin system toxin component, PIN family [Parapedobacter tibetensis]|uniref:putative toxin-antitoxin system toxin component, PIN family n=1 Tax=Parapedobacter tibetensis TaxID=2972951 RepID=UPI00214D13BF|nr:putative toxin-antitoxin system toxin component, PIN family [Parapedobacter tibetensis]